MADPKDKPKKVLKTVVTLDGDKGIYTREEVEALLDEAGLKVEISDPDGVVEDATVERQTS